MRFIEDDENDDPILSVVNLVDLFLVITAVLMVLIARRAERDEQGLLARAAG